MQSVSQTEKLTTLSNEIWKDIPGYEGWYQVSNLGRVKRLKTSLQSWKNKYC